MESTQTQSAGHIGFVGDFEYFEIDGEVYRASLSSVFDVRTNARIGRWECSRTHWERFGGMKRITG